MKHFRMNMTKKVFLYLLIACILPISMYGLFVYYKTNRIFKDEINNYTYDLIYNKQKNLELIMENVESLIVNISGLDDIRNTLMNENNDSSYYKLAAQAKIGYILSGYSNLNGLVSIDLFSMNGVHYHVGETLNYQNIRYDLKRRLFNEALLSNKIVTWHGLEDNVNLNSKNSKVIAASKVIKVVDKDTITEKAIGFIMVNYNVDAFTENIRGNTFENSLNIVVDNKNRIVYHPDKNMIGKEVNPSFISKLDKNTDHFMDSIDGEKTMITYIKSDKSQWKMIALVPLRTLDAKTSAISKYLVILMIIYFLMLLLFVSLISQKYLLPIRKITEQFKQLEEGNTDLSMKLEQSSDDEIGELATWFNAFLDGLKEKMRMEGELLDRENLLKGIADATNVLLRTTDYDHAFYKALEILGNSGKVDRVYIFQNHTDKDTGELFARQYSEWCREGIEPQIDNPDLQNIPYKDTGNMHWYNQLSQGKTISGPVKNLPENEGEILMPQGILSILVVPIFLDNDFWGFMGFDDCSTERRWSNIEEDTLKAAAISIGGALKRRQAEITLQNILKEDFKKTVQNLQNLVFKLKKDEAGNHIITLFEGKIAAELGVNSNDICGKMTKEVLPNYIFENVNNNFIKAFDGEIRCFDVEVDNKILYLTLSPISEGNTVNEVVGSAIDITEHRKAEDKIRYLAYYDTLTGLPNRVSFSERIHDAISNAEKNGLMAAILFLDLDQFKVINDTLGHAIGDELLKEVGNRLKECISHGVTISRMGGDEFTILLPEIKEEQDAETAAQRVLDSFKHPIIVNQYELFISTSIGISLYPRDGKDMETLLKNADIAMYKAKDHGRNNFQFYTSAMNLYAIERLNLESSLRKAIDQKEFYLDYQPKIEIKTGRVVGCEALIRWQHPELGLISPNDFIPLAEETGLIVPLGEWVLKTACYQNMIWHKAGYTYLNISVNISAKQFQHQNIIEIVSQVLKQTGLNPEHLELEITENCIMQNTERTVAIIDQLKNIGVKISIDDFGTGFSSMAYLRRFEVDKLKIDKSFIDNISCSPRNTAIVSAIINMAHSMNLGVIAEGVETEEQLLLLKSYNCNEVQGYLISPPLSVRKFMDFMENNKVIIIDTDVRIS